MRRDLLDYWCDPPVADNNCPMHYYGSNGWIRSGHLEQYLSKNMELQKDASIFEIGSGVGRNLAVLKFAGYDNLSGLELNPGSIQTMRAMMPVLVQCCVQEGPAEVLVHAIPSRNFDLVFTMAVLEHLPPESEHVFAQIARISQKYVLIIEDEHSVSHRHFPRNYKNVFEKLGLKQIDHRKKLCSITKLSLRLFSRRKED